MSPKLSRFVNPAPSVRRKRRRNRFALRCEQLEGRITPALFNVQDPLSFPGLNNNGCVATADLNKDGHMDAVLTNFGTDHGGGAGTTITVLYGNDEGGFDRVQLNTQGSNVSFVDIADINGDTFPDVVASNGNQQNTGSVTVFRNQNGNLSLFSTFFTLGNNAACVRLADVTGDGILDAVVANFGRDDGTGEDIEGNNVTIFQGQATAGKGNFNFTWIDTLEPEIQFIPTALVVADFDGDGNRDIAAAVPGVPPNEEDPHPNGSVYLFEGDGTGSFADPNLFDTGGALPVNIQAADLDGDTLPDLVVANAGNPNSDPAWAGDSVGVLMNVSSPGGVSFGVTKCLTANTDGTFAVAIADFDMNGTQDIAAINYGAQLFPPPESFVSVYMGSGTGNFSNGSPGQYDTGTGFGGGQYLAVGDFDADGVPDLIVAHATSLVGLLINTTEAVPTVTINQGATQADPTNGTSIVFDAVFSEGVQGFDGSDIDFTGSSDPGSLSAQVTQVSPSAYTVTVSGMTGMGIVRTSIPAGAATSTASGQSSLPSTSTDNEVGFDLLAPTVTINQAPNQTDPTSSSPIRFMVLFSEGVTGFTAADVDLSESSLTGLTAAVSQNTPNNYTVTVTGMSGNGTVVAKIVAGAATDAVGNLSSASTSTDNSVTFGQPTAPTVTINQGGSQLDPTNSTSIVFDVVFSAGVTGFTGSDIDFTGSTVGGLSAQVTQITPSVYTVAVTGMAGTGKVKASIPAGAATSIAGSLPSEASTSTDNEVTFDLVAPTVTINQAAGQLDPATSGPIQFTVVFSENVTGFTGADVDLSSSTVGGNLQASVSGSGTNYTVAVTGMTGAGTVVARIPAGVATDAAGGGNIASTSTDNSVAFDAVAPSVTVNQASGQADPTNISSINYAVVFSEAVTGFTSADVSLAGSTVGGTLSVTVTGSLNSYSVTVTGMTTRGFLVVSVPAGGAVDAAGNLNLASTSTDNSVEFLNNGVIGFTQAVYNTTEDDAMHTVTITVTRTGQFDGAVSIDYAATDGTAHSGGNVLKGQSDYTPGNGTLSWADGEGGNRTFTIPILPDALNEGKELINLALTNAVGFPGLGLTTATAAILPSDGQGPGLYLDQDSDKVRIQLFGKSGSLLYYRTDPDGDSRGQIELIELTGTLSDPLRPNALFITVFKSVTSTDNGTIGLGAITGSGLRRIFAPRANLNMEGINLDGYLFALRIGNILNGADIFTQPSSNPLQRTFINSLMIGDGTTINTGNQIGALTATRIGTGSIVAPGIGTMIVRGQPLIGIVGDMASDITLSGIGLPTGRKALGLLLVTGSIPSGADIAAPSVGTIGVRRNMSGDINIDGAGVDPNRKALVALRVLGTVSGSDVMVNGNVGGVRVGAFRDSRLFAGYSGADDGTGTFSQQPATVAAFNAFGKFIGFQNSRVIAANFQLVTIVNLLADNPATFGFYADLSLGAISVMGPTRFIYDPRISAPQGVDDFEVVVV